MLSMAILVQLGPFVLLLAAIMVLPLAAMGFWSSNRNKALVSLGLAIPSALWLLSQGTEGGERLRHTLGEYVQFILLLSALYALSGVLVVHGGLPGSPLSNTLWLGLGAVLANVLGTTGASMLLLRPFLRANHHRSSNSHIPVFFIFTVANCGGLLLPLGDPPLFLGFLEGVDFRWTLRLWPQWLLVNALVLVVFYVWDDWARRAEPVAPPSEKVPVAHRVHVEGLTMGVPLLAGVMGVLLLQAPPLARALGDWLRGFNPSAPDPLLPGWMGALLLAGLTGVAARSIHRSSHQARALIWEPLLEVAVLFAGIFVTMAPALHLLGTLPALPWTEARLFWATGGMSSILDNAPTYLTFATLAHPAGPAALAAEKPHWLAAISCGAVWMGAVTYIGNGPNFLIKAVADHMGYRTPSFFGYLAYSLPVLLPVFGLATLLFYL
jgi:Na+/H+ antiporter NhaD/arsenite permease-like protein